MKTLLIILLIFGVLGILMVAGVLLYCAWDYQAAERWQREQID